MVLLGQPPDGTIANYDTVLSSLDAAVGHSSDVEYLWVEGSYTGNVFGHAAIAYRHPETNEQVVMNIVGKTPGTQLVNFLPLREYLFGVQMMKGGAYNRNIYGLRIHGVGQQDLLAMHHQYVAVMHEAKAGRATFDIFGTRGPSGAVSRLLPFLNEGARLGNCAKWTSFGLIRAGLLPRVSLFPKNMLVRLMLRAASSAASSGRTCCLVKYARIEPPVEVHREYRSAPCPGLVSPIHFYHSYLFWNLDKYCAFSVRVKDNATRLAEIEANAKQVEIPQHLLAIHGHYLSMVLATIIVACWTSYLAAATFAVIVAAIW